MKVVKSILAYIKDMIYSGGQTAAQRWHNRAIKSIDKAIEQNKAAIDRMDRFKRILIDQIAELQDDVADIEESAAVMEQKQNSLSLARKALTPVIEEVESESNAKV